MFTDYDDTLTCEWQHQGSCVDACPTSTYPNSSLGACLDLEDFSSEANPAQYTVSAEGYFGGKSLKAVLEKLWMKYNDVLLVKTVNLLGDSVSDRGQLIKASTVTKVTLKAVCSSDANCSAEVRFMSPYIEIARSSAPVDLELRSVVLEGKYALQNNCTADSCSYCPYLISINGKYYDDRYNLYTKRPSWPVCSYEGVVALHGKKVVLTDVSFLNFRQGLKALISASESIYLSKVHFDNVRVANRTETAVIVLDCSSDVCDFKYKQGSVRRLNNGFELMKVTAQTGFLRLIRADTIEVQDVSFELSTVYQGSSVELGSPPLIYVEGCRRTMTFEQVTVDTLLMTNGLVQVVATEVQYPEGQSIGERGRLLAASHIKLKDFVVKSTNCAYLLLVEFGETLQNIVLEGLDVSGSAFTSSMLKASKPSLPDSVEIEGGVTPYITESFKTAIKAPSYFKLIGAVLSETYWATALAELTNLANISVQDVSLTKSGAYTGGLEDFAYAKLKVSSEIYAQDTRIFPSSLFCSSAFRVTTSVVGSFTDLDFKECKCSGVFGLETRAFQQQVSRRQLTVSHWTFYDITSTSLSSSLMQFTEMLEATLTIDSLDAELITNAQGRGAVVFSEGSLTISNSKFKAIHSLGVAGLFMEFVRTASLVSLEFQDLTADSSLGGCVNISFSETEAMMSVLDSKFVRCSTVRSGGALFIDFAPFSLVLLIKGSSFEGNVSAISGSAVYLTTSVILKNSSIESCSFTSNVTASKGVISLSLSSPILLTDLTFTKNTGGLCTCFILQEKGGLTVQMKSIKFQQNSSLNILCGEGVDAQSVFSIEDLTLEGNSGYTATILQSSIYVRGFKLLANTGPFSLLYSTATVADLEASDNSSTTGASVFEVLSSSTLECSGKFVKNRSVSGTIKVDSNSKVLLENCTFTENSSSEAASILYIVSSKQPNRIKDSSVIMNKSGGTGTFNIMESDLTLEGVVMRLNTADVISPGVIAQNSLLVIKDCVFSDQSGNNGAFIIATTNSNVRVSGSSFRFGQALKGGGVVVVQSSNLLMTDCEVSDISTAEGAAIQATARVEIEILRTHFSRITGKVGASAVLVYQGSLVMTQVTISDFVWTALRCDEMTSVVLDRVSILGKA
jgi:hypothetical protein